MVIKEVRIDSILDFLGNEVVCKYGDYTNVYINNITDVKRVNEHSLDWINSTKSNKQEIAENSPAKVLLVDTAINYSEELKQQRKILIVVENPKLVLIKIIRQFFSKKNEPGIDPSAFVHPNAKIGENVYIGPHCYIGDCIIGNGNIIHSGVHIYDRTVIGNNNVIHSGAAICVDGLGCFRLPDGRLEEFPQIGGVRIGSNCYIGANTHIASGSLSDTIIEDGCKINGMSFIGSNDVLHENVWITGSTMLAGSVEVGRNVNIFSKVVVRDWCNIGENAIIGMGAVVTKNVPCGEVWVGNPAKKLERS